MLPVNQTAMPAVVNEHTSPESTPRKPRSAAELRQKIGVTPAFGKKLVDLAKEGN